MKSRSIINVIYFIVLFFNIYYSSSVNAYSKMLLPCFLRHGNEKSENWQYHTPTDRRNNYLRNLPVFSTMYRNCYPLCFIQNLGQVNGDALYYAKTSQFTLWLTKEGIIFESLINMAKTNNIEKYVKKMDKLSHEKVNVNYERQYSMISRMNFLNSKSDKKIITGKINEYYVNYFIGKEPSKWISKVPTTNSIIYKNLYQNIDFRIYGTSDFVEYDFIVKPGGKVDAIQIELKGLLSNIIDVRKNPTQFYSNNLIHIEPKCYQIIKGKVIEVQGFFQKNGSGLYSFNVMEYDKMFDLIIDPVILVYSSFLGGYGFDVGSDIKIADNGDIIVSGATRSLDFPTSNAFQKTKIGPSINTDIFITRLSSKNNSMIYSTYFGGTGNEGGKICLDKEGNVYLFGETTSRDFPCKNVLKQTNIYIEDFRDTFISKMDASGTSLLFSTYWGGNGTDTATGISTDNKNNIYMFGQTRSKDFPTKNAFQKSYGGKKDLFLTKLELSTNTIIYSTYLGGSGEDWAGKLAVDNEGYTYIACKSESDDFPVGNLLQSHRKGYYLIKIDPVGTNMKYSLFFNCSYIGWGGIIIDENMNAYVTGFTESPDFPTVNAFQPELSGPRDVFLTKIASSGKSFIYSTFLGGSSYDNCNGIALDKYNNIYLIGSTKSDDFPTKNSYQKTIAGEWDCYITKIGPAGKELKYSSYIGGVRDDILLDIDIDESLNVYLTGVTGSKNFPTKNSFQKTHGISNSIYKNVLSFFKLLLDDEMKNKMLGTRQDAFIIKVYVPDAWP